MTMAKLYQSIPLEDGERVMEFKGKLVEIIAVRNIKAKSNYPFQNQSIKIKVQFQKQVPKIKVSLQKQVPKIKVSKSKCKIH